MATALLDSERAKLGSYRNIANVELANIGSFLTTRERLAMLETGHSFKTKFQSSIDAASGPGWIDRPVEQMDLSVLLMRNVYCYRTALKYEYESVETKFAQWKAKWSCPQPKIVSDSNGNEVSNGGDGASAGESPSPGNGGKRKTPLSSVSRVRKANRTALSEFLKMIAAVSTLNSTNNRFEKAEAAASTSESELRSSIDLYMPSWRLTRQIRMLAILTTFVVLLAPAVIRLLIFMAGSILPKEPRLHALPNWMAVSVMAVCASEYLFAVRWLPPFFRALWHRIEFVMMEEQEQPSPGDTSVRKHRQLEGHWRGLRRFLAFWMPAALLLGFILLPFLLIEWRWSVSEPPVCPNERRPPFQCLRKFDVQIDPTYPVIGLIFMIGIAFWSEVSDGSTIKLYRDFILCPRKPSLTALSRIRPLVRILFCATFAFGARADLLIVAYVGYEMCVAVRHLVRELLLSDTWKPVFDLWIPVMFYVLMVVPALPVVPYDLIPRIGYIRFRILSRESANAIFDVLQCVVWTICGLAIIHRVIERRLGISGPLTDWHFWTFLVRVRCPGAIEYHLDAPRSISRLNVDALLVVSVMLERIRCIYPAIRAVMLRPSFRETWFDVLMQQRIVPRLVPMAVPFIIWVICRLEMGCGNQYFSAGMRWIAAISTTFVFLTLVFTYPVASECLLIVLQLCCLCCP